MPRTIYTRGATEKDKSERELRDDAEESHWTGVRCWDWDWPFYLTIPEEPNELPGNNSDNGLPYGLKFPLRYGTSEAIGIDEMDDNMVRAFCFKDCVYYSTSRNAGSPIYRWDLYSRMYRYWFPSRAEDTDISHHAFFCQLLKVTFGGPTPTTSESIGRIASFHRYLCSRLDERMPPSKPDSLRRGYPADHPIFDNITLPSGFESVFGFPADNQLLSPEAEYRLRSTFSKCFMLYDEEKDWRIPHMKEGEVIPDPGAIVVWLQAEDVPQIVPGMSQITGEGLEHAVAFRCESVQLAMQCVLSADPGRAEKRREWHGHYQYELDQNESIYGTACECGFT